MGARHVFVFNMTVALHVILLILCGLSSCSGAFIGLSYGGTLFSPVKLKEALKEYDMSHVRLLDANPAVLEMLSNTEIEVSVGLSNEDVKSIGQSKSRAAAWVETNILSFVRNATLITSIIVGNEAVSSEDAADSLVPAMKAIHSVLVAAKLNEKIKVAAAFSFSMIEGVAHSSRVSLNKEYEWVLQQLLAFVSKTGSFLMLNAESRHRCRPYNDDFVQRVLYSAHNAVASLPYSDIPVVISQLCLLTKGHVHGVLHQGMDTELSKLSGLYMSFGGLMDSNPLQDVAASSSSYSGVARGLLDKNGVPSFSEENETAMTASFFSGNDTKITPAAPTAGGTWCVAKNNIDDSTLQVALDYACGLGGADCAEIQQGGVCFDPDNVQAHASFAFNNYYMKNGMLPGTCDFGGSAAVTILNPSHGNCVYQTSSGSSILNGTVPGGGTISGLAPSASNNSGGPFVRPLVVLSSFLSLLMAAMLYERF